jgi:hypothetical protein
MTRSTIHVDVPDADVEGPDDVLVEAGFDVEVASKTKGMAVAGILVFVAGFIGLSIMAGFFLAGYPDDWYPTEDAQGNIVNEAALQDLQELVGIMAFISVPLLFLGLTMYTYGRTYKGSDEVAALSRSEA